MRCRKADGHESQDEILDQQQHGELLREPHGDPLLGSRQLFRLSLAGAQDKIAVEADELGLWHPVLRDSAQQIRTRSRLILRVVSRAAVPLNTVLGAQAVL